MFGMGFMEILLIAIVAIIALGPEKLPSAMVDVAKFLKKFKAGVEDAKSSLDNELNISEMKEEAAKYKAQIEDAKNTLKIKENIDLGLNDIINEENSSKKDDEHSEKVSLKDSKKKKKKKENKTSEKVETPNKDNQENEINKFKVELEDFDGTEDIK